MKFIVSCFLACIYLIISTNAGAQNKFDYTHHSFKLLTFDVSKSYYPLGGTGFVIRKGENYYLITALHVFSKDTLYKDAWRTIPSPGLSKKDLIIQEYNKPWVMIHNEQLIQYSQSDAQIKYHWILHDSTRALDLGALKLMRPGKEITDFAISFDQLDPDTDISVGDGMVSGFPARSDSTIIFETRLNTSSTKGESSYFFDISCPPNLEGMSGSPVYTGIKSDKPTIKGVFVGQTIMRDRYFGTVVYAKYIRDLILKMEL